MATVPKIVASAQITKDPHVCGGKACIDDTRIRVIDIVRLQKPRSKCMPAQTPNRQPKAGSTRSRAPGASHDGPD